MREKLRAALRYYKSHIRTETAVSVVPVSAALLRIFSFYFRNQY